MKHCININLKCISKAQRIATSYLDNRKFYFCFSRGKREEPMVKCVRYALLNEGQLNQFKVMDHLSGWMFENLTSQLSGKLKTFKSRQRISTDSNILTSDKNIELERKKSLRIIVLQCEEVWLASASLLFNYYIRNRKIEK